MLKGIGYLHPVFVVLLILATVVLPPGALLSSEIHQPAEKQVVAPLPGENTSSQLNDEELKKWEEAASDNLVGNVPGPGAFLGTMIRLLATASAESDNRVKKLVAGIPQVLPELNKVLVAL